MVSIESPLVIHLLEALHDINTSVEELEKLIERKYLFEILSIMSNIVKIVL